MILLIDNYDSFTYNVFQLVSSLTKEEVRVIRNDAISVDEVFSLNPRCIILSPGPAHPAQSGVCLEIIEKCTNIPILGICLGHQAIGHVFGAQILQQEHPMHGKVDTLRISDETSLLFKSVKQAVPIMRYHSLYIDEDSLTRDFKVVARTNDGVIQAIEHKARPLYGVQFHPESYFTDSGSDIIQNFLRSVQLC